MGESVQNCFSLLSPVSAQLLAAVWVNSTTVDWQFDLPVISVDNTDGFEVIAIGSPGVVAVTITADPRVVRVTYDVPFTALATYLLAGDAALWSGSDYFPGQAGPLS